MPPIPLASLMLETEKLSGTFYQALWRSSDLEIERADRPRWMQSDFAAATPGFVSLRSHEANASSLMQATSRELLRRRQEVATRIWDQRILTAGTHAYAYLRQVSKTIGRADVAMNSLSTGAVSLATGSAAPVRSTAAVDTKARAVTVPQAIPSEPLEFRYGYLVLADTAFFTLRQTNAFELTLRRSRLLTSTLQPQLDAAPTFLSLSKPLRLGLPTATLTYAVHAPSLELALAQSFSPMADFSLSGTHDFARSAQRVYFSFGYRF